MPAIHSQTVMWLLTVLLPFVCLLVIYQYVPLPFQGASRDLFLPLKSFVVVETGDRWATDAVKLGAFKEQESNNSYTIEIVDYEVSLPAIMLTLLDFYDQEVVIESEGFAQLSVPANASRQECGANYRGNIGGVIVEKFVNGTAVFAEVDAFCVPEGVMFLDATSDLALHSTDVELRFRPCVVGGKKSICECQT